jgi:uncharacterized protein
MSTTFLTASWRKLIMAQYAIDPVILTPYLPPGLELDLSQNICYVSLVGFLFDRVRIKRLAIPFHTRFEEVNLRFYVTRTEPDGTRKRGVVFISELVPRAAITTTPEALTVSYAWHHSGTWHSLAVEADPTPQPIAPHSEEEFITEHYFGYTKRTRGDTSEYAVLHPRWSIYRIRCFTIQADFATLYGPAFAALNQQTPVGILLAEGSDVSVSTGTRLPG